MKTIAKAEKNTLDSTDNVEKRFKSQQQICVFFPSWRRRFWSGWGDVRGRASQMVWGGGGDPKTKNRTRLKTLLLCARDTKFGTSNQNWSRGVGMEHPPRVRPLVPHQQVCVDWGTFTTNFPAICIANAWGILQE